MADSRVIMTMEAFAALADDQLAAALTPVDPRRCPMAELQTLTDGQQILVSIQLLIADVLHGGFFHYFWTSGEFAEYAWAALRHIGAEECAGLVSFCNDQIAEQMELFDRAISDYLDSHDLRYYKKLRERFPQLAEADREFQALLPELRYRVVAFLRAYPEQFIRES